MRASRIGFFLLLLAGVIQGCRSVPYDPGTPIEDKRLLTLLSEKLDTKLPESFQVVHRVILTAANRQYDMEGYLVVKRPQCLRLVAKSALGGTLFDVVRNTEGETHIIGNQAGLRDSWVIKGAVRAVSALYLNRQWPRTFLVRHGPDMVGLARDLHGGVREEFLFDETAHRLVGYTRSVRNKCLYRMDFSGGKRFPQWPQPVAHTVRIADYVLNYRLTIQVVDLRPVEVEDSLFGILH